jgi:hypothetical protein
MAMRKILVPTLLLALTSSSCAALLGIGAGVAISQDMQDSNTYTAQLKKDIDVVWATVKVSLGKQTELPITVDNDMRAAVARIDDADVTVSVENFNLEQVRVIVSSRKYGVSNKEISQLVFSRVMKNFGGE